MNFVFENSFEKILCVDLETTGTDTHTGDWITGSFGVYDFKTLEKEREFNLNSRPRKWSQEAFEVHRIERKEAMSFPKRIETLRELVRNLPKEKFMFLCHANFINLHFDYAFLKSDFVYEVDIFTFWKYFSDLNVFSTHTLAKFLKKEKMIKCKSLKLDGLCDHFGIELDHHEASSDQNACLSVFKKLRGIYERGEDSFI